MKHYFILAFIALSACKSTHDSIQVTPERRSGGSFKLDPRLAYNYHTKEKIPTDRFLKMVQGGVFTVHPEFDSYGKVAKFYYDTTGHKGPLDPPKVLEIGKPFPEFNVTTINKEKIRFDELKGKHMVVRFELFPDNYDFSNDALLDLEDEMSIFGSDLVGLMIFRGSDSPLKSLQVPGTTFDYFIQNSNFFHRYGVTKIPTTVVIDKKGIVVGLFEYEENIDLSILE
ncbi:TlpA family protein disulfide reductase [Ekhidna sp.]|uniref:TlpA family protein disulfide reductase n=1 Tax=Ekhidna sp. TaxID=2608089 RepID=UPI003CCB9BFD